MKKKSLSAESISKDFLKEKLDDLRIELLTDVRDEVRLGIDEAKQELDDNAKKYRDQILSKLVGIAGDLETIKQENTVGGYQLSKLRQSIINHEKRIKKVERAQAAA